MSEIMADKEQVEDDAAIGHGVRVIVRELFKGPKGLLLLAILVGWGGREASLFFRPQPSVATEAKTMESISKKIDAMSKILVEVKVTNRAILNTLPADQRRRAESMIENSLADLRTAQELHP